MTGARTHARTARPRQRCWAVAVLCACGAALIAACGSSGASGTSPASPAASASASQVAFCRQVSSVRASLTSLVHVKPSPSSAGQIGTDLSDVQKGLADLKGQAGGKFNVQINHVASSLNALSEGARTLAKDPTLANLSALGASFTNLKTSAQALIAKMEAACPSS